MRTVCVHALGIAAILAILATSAPAEDVQLRAQAEALMNRAHAVSQIHGGPWNVRTEVTFTATASDGNLKSGTYTRLRANDGSLREDLTFGDYSSSDIHAGAQHGWTRGSGDPPFAVLRIRELVPYSAGSFDSTDVVREIRASSYAGHQAICIEFETIQGEDHLPGEACLDKSNGTLLELRTGSSLYEYSDYFTFEGGLSPAHIVNRETNFNLTADMKMERLEQKPEDAFDIPSNWAQGTACKQFQMPIPKSNPQPRGEGAPDAPVTDVAVYLYISPRGTVMRASVVKPVRPDLDAEALKLVSGWLYEPGTCNGVAQVFSISSVVHFQGR